MSPNGSDRSPRRTMRRKLPQALALGLVIATATGCSANDLPRLGLPSPVTAEGPLVLHMWQGSWIAALVVGALMWGLILWSVIFHRRKRTGVEIPPQTRYNVPIEALYTAVPIIIVSVLFYFVARDEATLTSTSAKPQHYVNVVGFQWNWAFNYENTEIPDPANKDAAYEVGTPKEVPTLWLPVNESVQFRLTSRDVIHDFWPVNFLMKMDVVPGVVNKFEVTPTVKGEYMGKCAELCGYDHSRMLFNVKVVDRADYDKHLAELRAKGQNGAVPSGLISMGSEEK